MIDTWKEIKCATNEICVSKGGTVTHHHAVGRDHRPNGYDVQRDDLFSKVLIEAKAALDPKGIMNPRDFKHPKTKTNTNSMTRVYEKY